MNLRTSEFVGWVVLNARSRIGNGQRAQTSSVVRKPTKSAGKPRPKRLPIRLGAIETAPIVNRLRDLHKLGEDRALSRFPATEELFLVLEHAQTWGTSCNSRTTVRST
ncbi:hypothetical protein ACFC4G_44280 [Streptomyces sp. NPDC056002]|uniref:hypothetical protein n=1 Tax=Streptomyces sp. NPDC056002 TaxID=3345675 RepID=UPI0035DFD9BB